MTPRATAAGAHWDGAGVRFRVVSRHAEGVELCLFESATEEADRHALERVSEDLWEVYVPDLAPGRLYGYRVAGPWEPARGHRFNPAKLLADPYGRAFTGEPIFDEALFGFDPEDPAKPDGRDSAAWAPKSVVVDPAFDWGEDRPPATPWSETAIYECHVGGMTRCHPGVPEALRGTYLGLATEPVLDHLRSLGVTAVELMPVHQIASEPHLGRRGLTNYFGYSPLGFLAPHSAYATAAGGEQVVEFKRMVKALHAAGLEVLLDVVFNHTAEGGAQGPTLSLRGIDNRSYYRLDPADPSRYEDLTGTGNTLDLRREAALRLIVDALAYWTEEMHVDGFRFDLAPALARDAEFEPRARLFRCIAEHPSLSRVKLIAEPWDLGRDGYNLGRFPAPWREWNDRFRDAARAFWRGDSRTAEPLRQALAGSRSLFTAPRDHSASIDFVTCHDGFTLADLVSYDRKHNEANGEDGRDGRDENLSRNWGVEGPTEDSEILTLRRRAQRNLLATLALARGVPMLSHGDEIGRTQRGNNNAYCHDSELTWVDWELDAERRELLRFARRAFTLQRELDTAREPIALSADGTVLENLSRRRLPLFALWHASPGGGLLTLLNGTDRVRLFRLPAAAPAPSGREADPSGAARVESWRVRLASFAGAGDRVERSTVRLPAHSLLTLEPTGAPTSV